MEEGREWKLCDKPFSHPLYFRGQQPSPLLEDAVWSERACTFSATALSLQKFSPWTVCLQAVQHWLYCTNQSLEAEVWNTQLKQELCLSLWGDGFLCSRLSSSGSDFNSAQRLTTTTTTKKRCTCVSVSITEVSNAPLPHLPPWSWGWIEFHAAVRGGSAALICSTLPLLFFSSQSLR